MKHSPSPHLETVLASEGVTTLLDMETGEATLAWLLSWCLSERDRLTLIKKDICESTFCTEFMN